MYWLLHLSADVYAPETRWLKFSIYFNALPDWSSYERCPVQSSIFFLLLFFLRGHFILLLFELEQRVIKEKPVLITRILFQLCYFWNRWPVESNFGPRIRTSCFCSRIGRGWKSNRNITVNAKKSYWWKMRCENSSKGFEHESIINYAFFHGFRPVYWLGLCIKGIELNPVIPY